MANITNLIKNIRKAVYGKDVRESIASAIEQTYEDAIANGHTDMEVVDARQGYDTLGQVIKKKIYYFNTVAEMKANTKLQAGDTCQTLGYHDINDGGAGFYQVIAAPIATINEGSYVSLTNNLIAKLITNRLNVKHFGAYGDGEHDDTQAIQNAINYIDDMINPNTLYTVPNELIIPTCKYKVSQKIVLPPYVKLRCEMSVFESIVDDDKTLSIEYTKNISDNANYYLSKSSFLNGDIISGGLTIIYKGEKDFGDTTNINIGLSVGNSDNTINNHISRCRISDVSIFNFSVGLLVNRINTYIIDFNHFHIEHNYAGIKIGDGEVARMTNSGENIIAGSVYGYWLNTIDFFSVSFIECSFDYNACVFYFPHYTSTHTTVYGGHIESVGYYNDYLPDINENTLDAFGCVGYYGGANYPNGFITLEFFGTWLQFLSSNYKTYRFKSVVKNNFGVAFNNTRILQNLSCSISDIFLCDENVFILNSNFDILFDHNLSRSRILLSKRLDTFDLDDINGLPTSANDPKSGYRIGNSSQFSMWSIVEDEAISEKSLKFSPGATTQNALLYRKIFTNGQRNMLVTPVVKSAIMTSLKFAMGYIFYDRNGNELSRRDEETDNIVKFTGAVNNVWNKASSAFSIEIPTQCDYVEMSIYVSKSDNTAFGEGNDILINGLYANVFN